MRPTFISQYTKKFSIYKYSYAFCLQDQALALRKIASMLVNGSSRDKDDHHITLIHGKLIILLLQ